MSELVAVATGTLERTPFDHLLTYCLDQGLSGTLVLQSPEDLRHAVLLQRGIPIKVKTGDAVVPLGRLLVERGVLPVEVVQEALMTVQSHPVSLGRALMDTGKLAFPQLAEVLKSQYQQKLVHLFSLPPTTAFGFYEKDLLESWGGPEPVHVDLLAVLSAGISSIPESARASSALASLQGNPIRLLPGVDFRRFGLSERGRAVLDLLRVKPMPLAELETAGVASPTVVHQTIYTFLLTRHLLLEGSKPPLGQEASKIMTSVTEANRAAVGRLKLKNIQRGGGIVEVNPTRNQTTPIPSILEELFPQGEGLPQQEALSPEMDARRQEILDRVQAIRQENFFQMLGLPQDAPMAAVQSAFFDIAKRWHPDRLPTPLAFLRDEVSRVFSHMNEAFQTLSNEARRSEYVELLKQGGGSPEEQAKVTRLLEAQSEFRRADTFFKKGDLATAERLASSAVEKDPEQPDYIALLAWIRANKPAVSPDDLAANIRFLDSALGASPNHQRSLWYRGSLLKRLGKESLAILDFRKLLDLDPRHIDAGREVRLFEMRHGSKEEGSKPLFGGIFNRKITKLNLTEPPRFSLPMAYPFRAPIVLSFLAASLVCLNEALAAPRPWSGSTGWRDAGFEPCRGLTIGPIENTRYPGRGYGSKPYQRAVREAISMGATWVSITPFGRVLDLKPSGVDLSFEAPFEQNRRDVLEAIRQAHIAGLKVMLVPHLWVESGEWRALIEPGDEAAWRRWTLGYRRFIEVWADVAEEGDVDLMSVGVEQRSWVTSRYAPLFQEMIAAVRARYHGPITYSANWDDVEDTLILGDLDVIGINAFYPLADKEGAPFSELLEGGRRIAIKIHALSERWQRPVLFTEIGYTTRPDPAIRPWEWPDGMKDVKVDEVAQADAYAALIAPLLDLPDFAGFFVWRLYADPDDSSQEAAWGFSPRQKLAELVLRDAFATHWASDLLLAPGSFIGASPPAPLQRRWSFIQYL